MITKTCLTCQREFSVSPSRQRLKFCSRECYLISHAHSAEVVCEVCRTVFHVRGYRAHTARFCSLVCGGAWHAKTRLNGKPKPYMRGNQFRKGLKPANAFTPEQVRALLTVHGTDYPCAQCGETFAVKPWIERQNVTKSGLRFCSKPCHNLYMTQRQSGAQSPLWVGGPTTYRGKGWLVQRARAVARDQGICQDCQRLVGKSIPVHHIKPFREFTSVEEANHLDNLLSLCQSCHMKRERLLQR